MSSMIYHEVYVFGAVGAINDCLGDEKKKKLANRRALTTVGGLIILALGYGHFRFLNIFLIE